MQAVTVLVVDGDQDVLHLVSDALNAAGHSTLEAESGTAAEALAREYAPRLSLLDPDIPGADGRPLAAALREAGLPFIALTDDPAAREQALEAGALACLPRRPAPETLTTLVDASLRQAAELSELRAAQAQMERAINQGRETSIAVGILMERCNLTALQAFDALRDDARSQRKKIADLARELLNAAETLHGLANRIGCRAEAKAGKPKRPPKRYPARAL